MEPVVEQRVPTFKESTAETALPFALKMLILDSQQPQFPMFSGLYLFKDFQRLPAAEVMPKVLCMPSQDPHLGLRHLFSLTSDSSLNTSSVLARPAWPPWHILGVSQDIPLGPLPLSLCSLFPYYPDHFSATPSI